MSKRLIIEVPHVNAQAAFAAAYHSVQDYGQVKIGTLCGDGWRIVDEADPTEAAPQDEARSDGERDALAGDATQDREVLVVWCEWDKHDPNGLWGRIRSQVETRLACSASASWDKAAHGGFARLNISRHHPEAVIAGLTRKYQETVADHSDAYAALVRLAEGIDATTDASEPVELLERTVRAELERRRASIEMTHLRMDSCGEVISCNINPTGKLTNTDLSDVNCLACLRTELERRRAPQVGAGKLVEAFRRAVEADQAAWLVWARGSIGKSHERARRRLNKAKARTEQAREELLAALGGRAE